MNSPSKPQSQKEIEPPSQSICLKFNDIQYSLKKGTKKEILRGVSGEAVPGRFLAILGSSGAGKSSLLNILAGRLRSNRKYRVRGEILINGNSKFKKESFQQNTAYVLQEDLIYETLRVREVFDLSAALRLSKKMKKEERKELVDKIIETLSLERCADSLVGGNQIRGVSGGERKRVCIGNELVKNPPLFFLDEPTSGLDSYTAICIVELLWRLAKSGRTVVATLHQPSSEMYDLFDDLIVMAAGRITYCGPADMALQTFEELGYPLPAKCNPADHFISVCTLRNEKDMPKIDLLADSYSAALKKVSTETQTPQKEDDEKKEDGELNRPLESKKIDHPGWLGQTRLLISKRSVKHYFRLPSTTYVRLAQMVFFSLLAGILFFDLGYDRGGVMARNGAIFFILTNITFNNVFNVIVVIPMEKKVFQNEILNGMYGPLPFFLSKVLVEVPINVIVVAFYQLVVYWMIGLGGTVSQFFILLLLLLTSAQIGYFLGMFLGVISPSSDIASALTSFILLPSILFSGFFIRAEDMPSWIRWVTYIDFFRYLMDMTVYNEFNNEIPQYNYCISPENCVIMTGKEILGLFNLQNLNFWLWYFIVVVFTVVFCVLTYVLLVVRSYKPIGKPLQKTTMD